MHLPPRFLPSHLNEGFTSRAGFLRYAPSSERKGSAPRCFPIRRGEQQQLLPRAKQRRSALAAPANIIDRLLSESAISHGARIIAGRHWHFCSWSTPQPSLG